MATCRATSNSAKERLVTSEEAPDAHVDDDHDAHALGQPRRKALFDTVNTFAVVTLAVCLVCAIMTVSPGANLAWKLGVKNQLIIIGFLLSVMNICTDRIQFASLLAVETRYGHSTLQNYNAILTKSIVSSHVSGYLRVALLLQLVLPLGLSLGYKQFIDGDTPRSIDQLSTGAHYGIEPPPLADYSSLTIPSYAWLTAFSGFSAKHPAKSETRLPDNLPSPYGYNVLVLSDRSTAVLDLPSNSYIASIRQRMQPNETWHMSASVNAFVSELDLSLDESRGNDTFWEMAFARFSALRRGSLKRSPAFGLIPKFSDDRSTGQASCLLGLYPDSELPIIQIATSASIDDSDKQAFREYAMRFNIKRRRCHAEWRVTTEDFSLLSGDCPNDSPEIDSLIVEMSPAPLEALPNLQSTLQWLGVSKPGEDVPAMKYSYYATAVAISFWARPLTQQSDTRKYKDTKYPPMDEVLVSIRPTLRASWVLYLIISIQPIIGIMGIVAGFLLRRTPVSTEFGLMALLAGVKRSSLDVLRGAAFSGKITKPVWLLIGVKYDGKQTAYESSESESLVQTAKSDNTGTIEYTICAEEPLHGQPKLSRGFVYS
ncbi:hypothetical protein IQ07DRAFT_631275 [Pyrenochaeta sp. DS3sAY3a]|nr:hypothetical protein IQ07DRAFT_631275 [Pyrenochaeta sp. DS3sAY3a]